VLLVDFTGLKVFDIRNLRKELKNNNIEFKVGKKTLVQKCLLKVILNLMCLIFPVSIALIFSPEEGILASKIAYKFSTEKKEPT
jgi:large subunit ribosomal protein L10